MKIGAFTGWHLYRDIVTNEYSIPYTHAVYLEYLCQHYEYVYLLACVVDHEQLDQKLTILHYSNLVIVPLPPSNSYLDAIKYFRKYYAAINSCVDVDLFYIRVPGPYCWLPKLMFNTQCIMHFVGDTLDCAIHNHQWNILRKIVMILGYLPEYLFTLLAARHSQVYTNGHHIADKLKKWNIRATSVISSTITEKELNDIFPNQYNTVIQLVYVGYLRYAKGIKTLFDIIERLKEKNIHFHFHIVGNGEMLEDFKLFISENNADNEVTLYGHIDDRCMVNKILRLSDLFIFPSLSEGSPRVVIEAMAQGLPVISTPVGSLPSVFRDGQEIRFVPYEDIDQFVRVIEEFINDRNKFTKQRNMAYETVKNNFTTEKFFRQIFT